MQAKHQCSRLDHVVCQNNEAKRQQFGHQVECRFKYDGKAYDLFAHFTSASGHTMLIAEHGLSRTEAQRLAERYCGENPHWAFTIHIQQ